MGDSNSKVDFVDRRIRFFSQFFVFLLLSYMICGLCYFNMTICQSCYDVFLYMSDLNNKIESIK